MNGRERLDVLLARRGLAPSRSRAQALIMAGDVLVDGQRIDRPGTRIAPSSRLALRKRPRYVSRGGEKLEAAIGGFSLKVCGATCADVGASTGGFTDCLLQHGAEKVYAIDVGYGQLDWKLRQDRRVVVLERSNARHLDWLEEPVDLVVVDVSFISLRLILPVVRGWLKEQADVVALVKPQFEAGKRDVSKGGVVRDPAVHRRVLKNVLAAAPTSGLAARGLLRSPLTGPAGNVEFLCWLQLRASPTGSSPEGLDSMIEAVL